MDLQENTLYDLDLGVKVTQNVAQYHPHHVSSGIFFECLRGRYKAPVPMANAYIFSQFEQKKSQSEGHFYVNQYS